VRKNLFISNSKAVPLALLGCLLLLLVTEGVARQYADRIRSFSDLIILYKKNLVEDEQLPYFNGVLLGDSRILGVDARLISDKLTQSVGRNVSFYNFSLPEHDVRGYYLFLKKYLKRHRPPAVILFSVSSDNWSGENNLPKSGVFMSGGLHRTCLLFSMAELAEVYPWTFWGMVFTAKIEGTSFLISHRRMIRNALENPVRLWAPYPPMANVTLGRNGGVHFGVGHPPSEEQIRQANAGTGVDAQSIFWFEKFLWLAREHGIRVVFFSAPWPQGMVLNSPVEGADFLKGILPGIQGRYENMFILEPVFVTYPREFFRDGEHLNGPGFDQFSEGLAQRLIGQFNFWPDIFGRVLD